MESFRNTSYWVTDRQGGRHASRETGEQRSCGLCNHVSSPVFTPRLCRALWCYSAVLLSTWMFIEHCPYFLELILQMYRARTSCTILKVCLIVYSVVGTFFFTCMVIVVWKCVGNVLIHELAVYLWKCVGSVWKCACGSFTASHVTKTNTTTAQLRRALKISRFRYFFPTTAQWTAGNHSCMTESISKWSAAAILKSVGGS